LDLATKKQGVNLYT